MRLVNDSDVVFISVPTPMTSEGVIDLSIVESVFEEVEKCIHPSSRPIFVLKSTAVPVQLREN